MENQIVCPKCKKVYANNLIVDTAAKGEGGTNTASIMCECGEKITYWQITAQLRIKKHLAPDSKIGSVILSTAEGRDRALPHPN